MVAIGLLWAQEARNAINWVLYFAIACSFHISQAITNSGLAAVCANFLITVGQGSGLGSKLILLPLLQISKRLSYSRENISSGSKLTPTQVLYTDIIDIMNVIGTQVGKAAAISGSKSNRFSFLKRLPSMLGLTYDIRCRPNDSKNHECVDCHHMSIIHPIEDDGPPYPVVAGKTLTRAPSKPTKSTLEQLTSCTCISNSCGNPNDDVGSNAPLCCTFDPEDDSTFDMSDPMLLATNPFAVRMEWINEGRKLYVHAGIACVNAPCIITRVIQHGLVMVCCYKSLIHKSRQTMIKQQ